MTAQDVASSRARRESVVSKSRVKFVNAVVVGSSSCNVGNVFNSSKLPLLLDQSETNSIKLSRRQPSLRKLERCKSSLPLSSSLSITTSKFTRFNLQRLLLFAFLTQLIIAHNYYSTNHCLSIGRDNTESGSAAQTGSRNSQQEKEEPRFAYEHAAYVSLEEEANKGKEKEQEKQKEALSGQLSSDPSANLRKILEAHPSERKAALLERITSAKLNYALVYLTTTLSGNQTLSSSHLAGREKRAPLSSSTATPTTTTQTGHKSNRVFGAYRTNVVIKAFNYKLRLNLELNDNLFGPNLIQKHFLPKGAQQISTQKIEHCYYHARSEPNTQPAAIGAFQTCNGLNGIIHVNNESFVIHPFYEANELNNKRPHIIYRYQADQNQQSAAGSGEADLSQTDLAVGQAAPSWRQCGTSRLHEWALRQYNKMLPDGPAKRSPQTPPEATPVVGAPSEPSCQRSEGQEGGFGQQFDSNEVGMSIPDSICSSRAVSVSQEANIFEPFVAATTIAHMLGHNLGMEHDLPAPAQQQQVVSGARYDNSVGYNALVDSSKAQVVPETTSTLAPLLVQAARKQAQQQPQTTPESNQLDGEEQDDEIKSRSIKSAQHELPAAAGSRFPLVGELCQENCLMSDHFNYFQAPVSIGNMIQQQVAPAPNESGTPPIVTMYNLSQLELDNELEREQHQQHQAVPAQLPVTEMRAKSQRATLPFRFSRQSLDTYHRLLRLGHGICLFNKPNQLEDFKSCGNGIVDKGEDCDCGTFKECLESDSCCDPITCRFKADAECINGSCCDRCKLRPKGFVCRKARGECDLAEQCDGKSGQCAPDVHKHNGHACQAGYCYLGQCPSHDLQCAELWGSDARRADRLCYGTFNANGTIRGNCGLEGPAQRPKYKRCEQEHLMCGTLQCQLGDMKPATAQLEPAPAAGYNNQSGQQQPAEFSKKILHTNDGQQHECKAVTAWPSAWSAAAAQRQWAYPAGSSGQPSPTAGSSGNQLNSMSYARDGSKCANNKVCFNQTCQPLDSVYRDAFELCPRDEKGRQCSANGVCSTANKCHCEPAWTGHDCSQRVPQPDISGQLEPAANTWPLATGELSDPTRGRLQLTAPAGGLLKAPLSQASVLVQPDSGVPTTPSPRADPPATPPPATEPPSQPTTMAQQQTGATQAPPAPQTSSSSAVQDKKKHDAFGAPTLVLILVIVVAAVFIGFATMANCYRRKGFLKPDKVLRHHQMNCKMDALRSSFIAKRLADADLARELADASGGQQVPGQDLLSPFVTPSLVPTGAAEGCQHQRLMYGNGGAGPQGNGAAPSGCPYDTGDSAFGQPLGPTRPSILSEAKKQHSFGYFEEPAQRQQHSQNIQQACIHQENPLLESSFGYAKQPADQLTSSDRVPLLLAADEQQQQQSGGRPRAVNQFGMRSFQVQRVATAAPHWANASTLNSRQSSRRQRAPSEQQSATFINRATSLGNVHRQDRSARVRPEAADEPAEEFELDNEAGSRHAASARQALATPLRTGRPSGHQLQQVAHSRRANFADDSCSAPSSPDHRNPYWSASSSRLADAAHQASFHEEAILSTLQPHLSHGAPAHSHHRHAHLSGQRPSVANVQSGGSKRTLDQAIRQLSFERRDLSELAHYRDDDIDDDDDDDDLQDMPPLPPPPPASHLFDDSGALIASGSGSDDNEPRSQLSAAQQHSGRKIRAATMSSEGAIRSPMSAHTIRRVPLNSGANESQLDGLEKLSLISQLQQLERVQSLHTKQVAGGLSEGGARKSFNAGDGLHEFFSLPLSVQLSALLARSLSQDPALASATLSTPIDEYLNTLNRSNVATSSRRSFRRANQQQQAGCYSTQALNEQQQLLQPTGTWSGGQTTMQQSKKQQVKLQNLQGLIHRLQKLHNQTVLQQQLEELGSRELGPDISATGRGRRSQSRGSSRAYHASADDSFAPTNSQGVKSEQDGGSWGKNGGQRRQLRSRQNSMAGNKNESVYSMSDSEDGAFVSRMLISYHQQKVAPSQNQDAQDDSEPIIEQTNSQTEDSSLDNNNKLRTNQQQRPQQTAVVDAESSVSPPSSNVDPGFRRSNSSDVNHTDKQVTAKREGSSSKQEAADATPQV